MTKTLQQAHTQTLCIDSPNSCYLPSRFNDFKENLRYRLKECFKTCFFLAVKTDRSHTHILLYLPWVISYNWLEVSVVRRIFVTYWVTNVWDMSFSLFYHTGFSIAELTHVTVCWQNLESNRSWSQGKKKKKDVEKGCFRTASQTRKQPDQTSQTRRLKCWRAWCAEILTLQVRWKTAPTTARISQIPGGLQSIQQLWKHYSELAGFGTSNWSHSSQGLNWARMTVYERIL